MWAKYQITSFLSFFMLGIGRDYRMGDWGYMENYKYSRRCTKGKPSGKVARGFAYIDRTTKLVSLLKEAGNYVSLFSDMNSYSRLVRFPKLVGRISSRLQYKCRKLSSPSSQSESGKLTSLLLFSSR